MSFDMKEMEQFVRREAKRFRSIMRETDNIILPFLRFHLMTENLLERIIKCHLARPKRFLDRARPSYKAKLHLVHSFNVLDERTIHAIENLNQIRNKLAHCGTESISVEYVDQIGNHFGSEYHELRAEWLSDIKELMCCAFELILFGLFTTVYSLEHNEKGVRSIFTGGKRGSVAF